MDLNIKKLPIHLQTNFQFFHISMTEHNHFSFKIGTCRRQWHPTPVLLPGESHGQRSLAGCSPWGREESDTTKWLHFHFSLSCIGEGNGNPLQCSCLENPRDGRAWWAAVSRVAQSRTRLKRLSSSILHVWMNHPFLFYLFIYLFLNFILFLNFTKSY